MQTGDVILSGSFVRAVPFDANRSLVALFDGLGEVTKGDGMSYSIEHNILDPNLYVKHQGLPHELYDLWREQGSALESPTSDYEAPGSDSSMSKVFMCSPDIRTCLMPHAIRSSILRTTRAT